MLTILDSTRYEQHRQSRTTRANFLHELALPMLLFGSMGAITWAIRGTSGWGGIDGVIVPGMTWALLWYYLCYRKGIDARGIVLWLGLGLALGGELGYGQYVSWIRGMFNVEDRIVSISPWIGYAWFAICGLGSGATGGILLGWALGGPASRWQWLVRALLLGALLAIIFKMGASLFGTGVIDGLSSVIAGKSPGLLFPHAELGIYVGEVGNHQQRTLYTNTQNFAVLIWWIAAMIVAALQRDRATLVSGAIIGVGFGIGFPLAALWCLGYGYAPEAVDWWKMWELNAGFNLGVLYVLVLRWSIRRMDKAQEADTSPVGLPGEARPYENTLLKALGGFVLVVATGYEYFFWTSIALGASFVAMTFIAAATADRKEQAASIEDRCKNVMLIFSVFLLVFILIRGGTSRAGVLLELYDAKAVDQYAWPAARVALFLPPVILLVGVALYALWRTLHRTMQHGLPPPNRSRLPERMIDLCAFIGVIGAASIWPEKIGVLYALFLALALFALTGLNRGLDDIEKST